MTLIARIYREGSSIKLLLIRFCLSHVNITPLGFVPLDLATKCQTIEVGNLPFNLPVSFLGVSSL